MYDRKKKPVDIKVEKFELKGKMPSEAFLAIILPLHQKGWPPLI
jgi:hypothetical protein